MIGIDSIRIKTKGVVSTNTRNKMAEQQKVTTHRNPDESVYNTYKYRLGGPGDNRMPLLLYTQESGKIELSIPSLPYFIQGSCLTPIREADVPLFYQKISERLAEELDYAVEETIDNWIVPKMDIYHDFHVGNDVRNYLRALKEVSVPTYKTWNINNETVYWRNGSRDIKFYDKHVECIEARKTAMEIEQSEGVLRFEVQLKTSDIQSGVKDGAVTLGTLMSEEVTNNLLNKYLSKIDMNNLLITTEEEMRTTLAERYDSKRAHDIVSFIKAKQSGYGEVISRSTEHRYMTDLRRVGLAPVIAEKQLPPLAIAI
ncbi:phage/plasmid replication domain-containing protein [Oceanobacillus picturae]|uniref:phage/plasmid replication domain-containing protein n=1 Tax=Oceanobacillus picturae TaxID=171693 RepID=UPI000E68D990|nr:phage/plasmid replication protein [Oceanobacillus picturae]RIU93426.1 hypothetical protein D1864_08145 [Oceanobacillus picturae]